MDTIDFVKESNAIEGIKRPPTKEEINEHNRFVRLDVITVKELEKFVSVYQSDASIRNEPGMNVIIGSHLPPNGGPLIVGYLENILHEIEFKLPYSVHVAYEKLHPFADGNGRSGRALWAWQMTQTYGGITLPFLHHFYYQSLNASREED